MKDSAAKREIPGPGRKDIPTLVKDSSLVEERRRRLVEAAVGLFVRKGYHATTTREIAREAGFSVGLVYEYVKSKEDVLYLVCDAIHREMEARLAGAVGNGERSRADYARERDDDDDKDNDDEGGGGRVRRVRGIAGGRDSRLRGNDKGGGNDKKGGGNESEVEDSSRFPLRASCSDAGATLESAIASYFEVCDEMQDSILLIYRETASLARESQPYVLEAEKRIAGIFAAILKRGVKDGSFRFANARALELMAHNIVVLGHMWAFRRWFLRERFSLKEYTKQQVSVILGEVRGQ